MKEPPPPTTASLQAYSDSLFDKSTVSADAETLGHIVACLRDEEVSIAGANRAAQIVIVQTLAPRSDLRLSTLQSLSASFRELLLAYLTLSDSELSGATERMLTRLRRSLVQELAAGASFEGFALDLLAAMAIFCFMTEYVFAETAEELSVVGDLRCADPAELAALGCFKPLHNVALARGWLNAPGQSPLVSRMLKVQLAEPLEEQRLKSEIRQLSPISDLTSATVRAMYEENPYPRWIRRPLQAGPIPANAENAEILVAGCGSGRQPISIAVNYPKSCVTALDISTASLAYAARKARAYGITNLTFVHGDLLDVEKLGIAFHYVSSVGVLHHMAKPEEGLKALLKVLRPGGQLELALYSDIARREVAAGVELRKAGNFEATAEGIRAFRQMILALPPGAPGRNLKFATDFFSISGCRDLVFHVQEHRFTLPALDSLLRRHKLALKQLILPDDVKAAFRRTFPRASELDLQAWAKFEDANPDTFTRMYHILAGKP